MWPFPADLMRARPISTRSTSRERRQADPTGNGCRPAQAPGQRHAATARVRHRNTAVYNSVVALATKSPTRITSPRIVTWEIEMARGTVKWFNPTKGYGFIQPQGGGDADAPHPLPLCARRERPRHGRAAEKR